MLPESKKKMRKLVILEFILLVLTVCLTAMFDINSTAGIVKIVVFNILYQFIVISEIIE